MTRENSMPNKEQNVNNDDTTGVAHDLDDLKARGGPFVEAVEATRMPMLVTDAQAPSSPIIYANRAFLRMLGREPGEVIGRSYISIAGEHADPETTARIEAALASRNRSTDELLFRAKD